MMRKHSSALELGSGVIVAWLLVLCIGLLCACQRKQLPAPALSSEAEHGRELYARMCAVCHGTKGEGYRADQAPRLAQSDFLATVSDDFLRRAITHGRANTTMSAWGAERGGPLSRADVDALVVFMRGWATTPRVQLDERPRSGDVARAEAVYANLCQHCHGVRGASGPNLHIGDRELLASASDGFLRHAIQKGRAGTPMLGFEKTLGPERIEDLVALLRSWTLPPAALDPELPRAPVHPPPLPLGPVPLNPAGKPPNGFNAHPGVTSVDVVKAALDQGARFALLDARAPTDYTTEHIAGAVSVPFYDPAPYFDALPKNAWLVCYCACPHAESGQLAQKLVAKGFSKVTVLDEGLGVWKARKYPTRAGNKP